MGTSKPANGGGPGELEACGEALVAEYMDQVAPQISPAAVQTRVEGGSPA